MISRTLASVFDREGQDVAYDELLAMKVRDAFGHTKGVTEKRMMGGVCFPLNGNMVCGIDKTRAGADRFMLRVGKGNAAAVKLRGGVVVKMGERAMPGFCLVDDAPCTENGFNAWLETAKRM